ncbi:Foldase protein PrsA [Frankliniella fusca]|uniref:Foldase protein PrsA n=1 Tax=Frankliniella fusca TaxID=407009 RepID=A0AAE1HQC0_9NEOP|nr:Foldase protein PrsA [Frankliniella fusca]
MSVHEVYQYPGTKQYNPLTQEDGLLSGYIRCFMALKMQASGWPADCTTDELKAQFIKDTLKHDGVDLDPSKMEKNPALRTLSKLIRPGEPDIPTGTHLGDLTDQVEEDHGPGSFITEFVAGGPKNYAFKVAVEGDLSNIKVCIKVRGISINASCDELVTFDNLKAMVMGSRDKITVPIPHQIARLPTWQIVTRASHKNWKPVNIKRRRVDVENTVPHGFNACDMAEEEDQDLLEAMDLLADA